MGNQTLTLNDSGAITVNSTVANNELINAALLLGTDGTTQPFTLTNNSTTNTLTLAGSIAGSTGSGVKTLSVAGAGSTVISGIIGNGTTGTVALAMNGPGVLTLSGVNTFNGGTTISAGAVDINANLNLGATGNAVSLNGGTLNVQAGAAITDTQVFTIGASGGAINILDAGVPTNNYVFNTTNTLLKRDADGHRRQSPFGRDEHLLRKHDYSERRIVRVWYFWARCQPRPHSTSIAAAS